MWNTEDKNKIINAARMMSLDEILNAGIKTRFEDIDDAMYYYEKEGNSKFLDYCIQDIEKAIDFLPKVFISDSAVDTVCHGSPLAVPGIVKMNNFMVGETIFMSTLK